MGNKIVIFPCSGDCAAGRITWIAAQELVLDGKAEWFSADPRKAKDCDTNFPRTFIVVDGCESRCLYNICLESGVLGKHHLVLADLGIEPLYLQDITRKDIELAKDGVIAECAEVDSMRPPLFSGCCCR